MKTIHFLSCITSRLVPSCGDSPFTDYRFRYLLPLGSQGPGGLEYQERRCKLRPVQPATKPSDRERMRCMEEIIQGYSTEAKNESVLSSKTQ